MHKRKKIYINGYFFTGNPNSGVYRFAYNMLFSIDKLCSDSHYDLFLVIPEYNNVVPELKNIKVIKLAKSINQYIWEQIQLPLTVKSNFLINLTNFAPVFKTNQLCVIHDALIFRYPQAYTKKFVILTRLFHKLIFKNSKYIATVSNFSKNELYSCMKRNSGFHEVLVLGNSAEHINNIQQDDSIIEKYGLKNGSYILSVLSQKNSFYKNTEMILNVAKDIDIPMVCVGNVDKNIFKSCSNLIHVGQVNDAELKSLYSNAKLFLMPSFYEGFGIPILEAMENNCPVVVSDIPVFREICGDAAIYIDHYNYQSAKSKIDALILNEQMINEMKQNAGTVIQNYRWDIFAKKILEVINKNENLIN